MTRSLTPRTGNTGGTGSSEPLYIRILLYGSSEGGDPSGAEWDCKQVLRRLGCNEADIDSATAYARTTGEDVWRQRFLFELR